MPSVITAGELLVEIMRTKTGVPFDEAGEFVGPFPSGAPGIFVDAVARLGRSASIVGGVGDDDFGRCITRRLEADGVDTSTVRTSSDLATGVAFVTYFEDGSREFIYHMANAAAGIVGPEDVPESAVADADAVHVNGSSLLMNDSMRDACYAMVDAAAAADTLVSFDPNVRAELLGPDSERDVIEPVLERTDLLLPTADELEFLAGERIDDTDRAARALLDDGVSLVAVTRGSEGCSLYNTDGSVHHDGFEMDAVDPTGAGDAFSAATVVGTLEGLSLDELAAFANASGAHAVAAQGPMEGLATRERIDRFLADA